MMSQRRTYTGEFRIEAFRLVNEADAAFPGRERFPLAMSRRDISKKRLFAGICG